MSPEQQMQEIQQITERWLRVLEKDIQRLIVKKGKPANIVHSACMNAAARLATGTVLSNPNHLHEQMFRNFDLIVTNIYQQEMQSRGPQLIVPGSMIN